MMVSEFQEGDWPEAALLRRNKIEVYAQNTPMQALNAALQQRPLMTRGFQAGCHPSMACEGTTRIFPMRTPGSLEPARHAVIVTSRKRRYVATPAGAYPMQQANLQFIVRYRLQVHSAFRSSRFGSPDGAARSVDPCAKFASLRRYAPKPAVVEYCISMGRMKSSYLFAAILVTSTVSAAAAGKGAKTGLALVCAAIALLALLRIV